MLDYWWLSPLVSGMSSIIALVGSFAVNLHYGSRSVAKRAREQQTIAWHTHVYETIRDFRESYAVLSIIVNDGYDASFPEHNHITKLGIPETLLTTKIINIGDLTPEERTRAVWLETILVNINRDVAAIVRIIDQDRRTTFDRAVAELARKFYNLANKLLRENPAVLSPKQSSDHKTIIYEDGHETAGPPFALQPKDEGDERLRPAC